MGKIQTLNMAALSRAQVKVQYFDNGEPLAGMCVNDIELILE